SIGLSTCLCSRFCAGSSMPHVVTAAAPAICTPTFRRQIFPRRRRAILSIYMRTLATVTLANPDLKSVSDNRVLCGRLCDAALTAAAAGAAGEHDVVRAEPDWR